MMNFKFKTIEFGFRGWGYFFQKRWYSFYRFKNPQDMYNNEIFKIIDIGSFFIVFVYDKI